LSSLTVRAVLLLSLCAALSACGAGEEATVQRSAQQFLDLTASGDPAACELLAPLARAAVDREGCGAALARVGRATGAVVTVSAWGDEAQAKDQAGNTMFLHDSTAGWRVTGAGCTLHNEQLYRCAVGGP
jgi:hypothetical protein